MITVKYQKRGVVFPRIEILVDCPICDGFSRAPITLGVDSKTLLRNCRLKLKCGHVVTTDIRYPPDYKGLK